MRKEKLISPRPLNTIIKQLGVKKSKATATFLVLYNLFKKRLKGRPAQNINRMIKEKDLPSPKIVSTL
jgi:hypothetical protein